MSSPIRTSAIALGALWLCLLPAPGLAQSRAASSSSAAKPVRLDAKAAPARTSGSLPAYPDDARQRKLGGVVTLDVTIDGKGKVTNVTMLRSIPALEAASSAAVRGWQFAPPASTHGAPALVTVVFYFDPDSAKVEEVRRIPPQGPQPKKTKTVAATAPSSMKAGATGQVVLEAVVNRAGRVIDTRVVSGGGASLQAAARDAVRQWEYEPLVAAGATVPFVVTITVLFHGA